MVGSSKRFDSDIATSGTSLYRLVRGKGGFNLTGSALFYHEACLLLRGAAEASSPGISRLPTI
jgi:hypothetical protein